MKTEFHNCHCSECKELLKEALDRLKTPEYENNIVLIVDNASTDGTKDYMSFNSFDGLYQYPLGEGESTRHGRFNFIDFLQPNGIFGRLVLTVTSYRVQEGWRYDIPVDKQKPIEYVSPDYIGYVPTPEPVLTEEPYPEYSVQDGEPETDVPPVG